MIIEYLQKYQEELIAKKIDIKEELELVESKIKETKKFVEILDTTNESYFNNFTPRKINSKNMERMDELIASKKELEKNKSQLLNSLLDINQRLLELEKVIIEVKDKETKEKELEQNNIIESDKIISPYDTNKIIDMCNNVKQYLFLDPMRSKLELDKLINILKNTE